MDDRCDEGKPELCHGGSVRKVLLFVVHKNILLKWFSVPDFIIPYSGYGLFFILRVLAEYFLHLSTIEGLCRRFGRHAGV